LRGRPLAISWLRCADLPQAVLARGKGISAGPALHGDQLPSRGRCRSTHR
jgi:hypothetical protein